MTKINDSTLREALLDMPTRAIVDIAVHCLRRLDMALTHIEKLDGRLNDEISARIKCEGDLLDLLGKTGPHT